MKLIGEYAQVQIDMTKKNMLLWCSLLHIVLQKIYNLSE